MGSSPLKALNRELASVTRLAIDTAPIIYFLEENPRYIALVDAVFQRIDAGRLAGVTSVISLAEVLTKPIRAGRFDLRDAYVDLLLGSKRFSTFGIDALVASHAAELRARHNLRTPDALQIACGLQADCEAILTNDRDLKRIDELRVLVLEDLVET